MKLSSAESVIDTSVLIAAFLESDRFHVPCFELWQKGGLAIYSHALNETFSTLTGGRIEPRVPASVVAKLFDKEVLPKVTILTLPPKAMAAAFGEAERRGVRGGAVYDLFHLMAAKHAGAERLFTLDVRDFKAFHRPGDPEIMHPKDAQ
jgi:predicted nucleic acid-binding protein